MASSRDSQNIARNGEHYSFLARLGHKRVAWLADMLGAGIHFNTLVHLGGGLIKYGVVSTASVLRDLSAWDRLYVAGRLHKPVRGSAGCSVTQ